MHGGERYTHIYNYTSQKYNSTGFVKCVHPEPNMSIRYETSIIPESSFLTPVVSSHRQPLF